ncbi:MAG: TIR domain-containing protein [Steroidobacteraceae bacterium]
MAHSPPKVTRLFVSYASADRQLIAPLLEFLAAQGWDVWWDRRIEAGEVFDRRIEQALAAADCVVVVWSRASIESNWVLSEAMAGFESKRLVPVALDARLQIPLPFNRLHAASLVDWSGAQDHPGLAELAAGIRATVETQGMRGAHTVDAPAVRKPVVAVLPFDDLDTASSPRPACSVIATRLIAALGHFSGLETISRRASFDAGLQSQEIRAVARSLRADFVVTGNVSGTGTAMVIGAELIEGGSGRQCWSTSLVPDAGGALDPEAAAGAIARELSGEFLRLGRDRARDGAARGDVLAAVEASRDTLLKSSRAAIAATKADARRALALSPDSGQAHALLASAIAEEIVNGYADDLDAACAGARCAAEQAITLCPDDHAVLKYAGHVLATCGDHEQGERVLRRALELNRYDDGTRGYLGWVLAPSTSTEHLDEVRATLDKLLAGTGKHPGRPFWLLHRSVALTCGGDFEGALTAARTAVNFSPNLALAWLHAVNALGQLGREPEARALIERCPLDLARAGVSWEAVIRLISRDETAAERRIAGLRAVGLVGARPDHSRVGTEGLLLQDFTALWRRVSGCGELAAESARRAVFDRYREPARRYHTLAHIRHCLEQADLAAAELPNADALRLAIWFHDVVYEPAATDNEARSAEQFRALAAAFLPDALIEDVARLVLVTRYGETPGRDDEAYMHDIDYSSFGLPWDEFLQDSLAVRAERPDLADAEFAGPHSRFLEDLLGRDTLYCTQFFRSRYEGVARANIARYLQMIRHGGT